METASGIKYAVGDKTVNCEISRSPKVWVDAIMPGREWLSENMALYSSRMVAAAQRASSASSRKIV
jgi:hypothetical protein